MEKIKTTILESNYKKTDKYTYEKDKGRYISVIRISDIGDKYLNLSLSRIYHGKEFQILNEKRKISKLQVHIKSLLDNESIKTFQILGEYYHVEVSCYYKTEDLGDFEHLDKMIDDIKEFICLKNFTDVDGLLNIHGVSNGRCFRTIDKESAEKLHEYLKQDKRILKIAEKYQDEYELIFYPPFSSKNNLK